MVDGFRVDSRWERLVSRMRRAVYFREANIRSALIYAAEIVVTTSKKEYLSAKEEKITSIIEGKKKEISIFTVKALAVRTGRLRSSMTRSAPHKSGRTHFIEVGTNVNYGRFWEQGFVHWPSGRWMPPRKFIEPSLRDNYEKIRKRFEKIGVGI